MDQINALLLQRRAKAAHSSEGVGLENHDRFAIANAVGESADPSLVSVTPVGPPRRVLTAVAARNVVGDKNR